MKLRAIKDADACRSSMSGFRDAVEGLNLTPRMFIEKYVVPGMSATSVQRGSYLGGFFTETDKEGNTVQDPDWTNRIKYKMLFAKLMGATSDDKTKVRLSELGLLERVRPCAWSLSDRRSIDHEIEKAAGKGQACWFQFHSRRISETYKTEGAPLWILLRKSSNRMRWA
jgi:hypothetical protein